MTFLILALFVPTAAGMVSNLEKDSAVSLAKAEADKIADGAKRAYYSGSGSTGTVCISLSGGSSLIIGGEGSDSYSISILLDDRIIEKIYLQRPSIRFLGDPLQLMGSRTVSIECAIENGVYGIKVSVID